MPIDQSVFDKIANGNLLEFSHLDPLSAEEVSKFVTALQDPRTQLLSLTLRYLGINNEALAAFAHALTANTRLQHLNLSSYLESIKINDAAVEAWAKMLTANKTLCLISLRGIYINDRQLTTLTEALGHNPDSSLVDFYFGYARAQNPYQDNLELLQEQRRSQEELKLSDLLYRKKIKISAHRLLHGAADMGMSIKIQIIDKENRVETVAFTGPDQGEHFIQILQEDDPICMAILVAESRETPIPERISKTLALLLPRLRLTNNVMEVSIPEDHETDYTLFRNELNELTCDNRKRFMIAERGSLSLRIDSIINALKRPEINVSAITTSLDPLIEEGTRLFEGDKSSEPLQLFKRQVFINHDFLELAVLLLERKVYPESPFLWLNDLIMSDLFSFLPPIYCHTKEFQQRIELLFRLNIDLNQQDKDGNTLLQKTLMSTHVDLTLLDFLYEKGLDPTYQGPVYKDGRIYHPVILVKSRHYHPLQLKQALLTWLSNKGVNDNPYALMLISIQKSDKKSVRFLLQQLGVVIPEEAEFQLIMDSPELKVALGKIEKHQYLDFLDAILITGIRRCELIPPNYYADSTLIENTDDFFYNVIKVLAKEKCMLAGITFARVCYRATPKNLRALIDLAMSNDKLTYIGFDTPRYSPDDYVESLMRQLLLCNREKDTHKKERVYKEFSEQRNEIGGRGTCMRAVTAGFFGGSCLPPSGAALDPKEPTILASSILLGNHFADFRSSINEEI